MDQDLLPDGSAFAFWDDSTPPGREWIVAQHDPAADDHNEGTATAPLLSIAAALEQARAGDTVRIQSGVYRECLRPGHGGDGPAAMLAIVGEAGAVISGAELIEAAWWEHSTGWSGRSRCPAELWSVTLPRRWFVGDNPFAQPNRAHWGDLGGFDQTRSSRAPLLAQRCGLLLQDDRRLRQVNDYKELSGGDGRYFVDAAGLQLHVRPFGDRPPQESTWEATARSQAIMPDVAELGWIHLRNLTIRRCGNRFPFIPQDGAICANRGHHWIVEDCLIETVNGIGIDLGRRDARMKTATIPGHHIVRRNQVRDCGICGIAGIHLAHSLIEDNLVESCCWHDVEEMWESAGIKTHHNHDTLVRRNRVRDIPFGSGIWLDYANRNMRCCHNVVSDVQGLFGGIFVEASHVANRVDHNLVYDIRQVPETSGGHAIYSHDTDFLQVDHNCCWRCDTEAIFLHKGQADRMVDGRGSCSRHHQIHDNLIVDCGKAIGLAHPDSDCHDNVYAGLRLAGPFRLLELDEHLDLDSWQGFHGLDRTSCVATCSLRLEGTQLIVRGPLPERTEPAGPFEDWTDGAAIHLDPRPSH